MEEEVTGGAVRLGKKEGAEEVDYKTKAGTAWSHSYLNQKPWHPLSYPNQRRKWIAEQTHANRALRQEEVAREFAQEQEFFRQTALFSKKEKEKMEMMKAVSFMYVRPPGYNAESAKAAEIADEKMRSEPDKNNATQDPTAASTSTMPQKGAEKNHANKDKKGRPKDVFGRPLPTEEEFEVLKNAPRMDTGAPVRIKPFGIEIRNVRCVRCGTYGHQSGDRECPLKDVIMPNEESRLKRDDPLTAIMAQTDSSEPLKWELKQKPGMSPPRGGFRPDDPNQQIVADDIFDEYGGFLGGGDIPALLSNFSADKPKKHFKSKSKHIHHSSASHRESKKHHDATQSLPSSDSEAEKRYKSSWKGKHRKKQDSSDSEAEKRNKSSRKGKHRKKQDSSETSHSDAEVEIEKSRSKSNHKRQHSFETSASDSEVKVEPRRGHSKRDHKRQERPESSSAEAESDYERRGRLKGRWKERRQQRDSSSSGRSDLDHRRRHRRHHHHHQHRRK